MHFKDLGYHICAHLRHTENIQGLNQVHGVTAEPLAVLTHLLLYFITKY